MSATWKAVLIGAGAGALLGGVYAANPQDIPSAPQIGQALHSPWVWMAVGSYYILGFVLLAAFFKPRSLHQWAAVASGSVLWSTF